MRVYVDLWGVLIILGTALGLWALHWMYRHPERVATWWLPGMGRGTAQGTHRGDRTGSSSPEAPLAVVARLEAIEDALARLEAHTLPRTTQEARQPWTPLPGYPPPSPGRRGESVTVGAQPAPAIRTLADTLRIRREEVDGPPAPMAREDFLAEYQATPPPQERCGATFTGATGTDRCVRPEGHRGRHQTTIPAGPEPRGGYASGPASPTPPKPPTSTGPGAPPSPGTHPITVVAPCDHLTSHGTCIRCGAPAPPPPGTEVAHAAWCALAPADHPGPCWQAADLEAPAAPEHPSGRPDGLLGALVALNGTPTPTPGLLPPLRTCCGSTEDGPHHHYCPAHPDTPG